MKPTKPLKCRHKGCQTTHRSPSGFCAEHAEDQMKHKMHVQEGRREPMPHLAEELPYRGDW